MPTIELTQGQRAHVDWQDYKVLAQHKWCAQYDPNIDGFYAIRHTSAAGGLKPHRIAMARQIMGLVEGDARQVDHKDRNSLDNRHRNLRICTPRENCENRRNPSVWGSGVYRIRSGRFQAMARVGGKLACFGTFDTPEEAREARRKALE